MEIGFIWEIERRSSLSEDETEALYFVAWNVASLYDGPSSSAELVSQAIMGDKVTAGEAKDGFRYVTTEDRYAGWVSEASLVPEWDRTEHLQTGIATLFADVFSMPDPQSELLTKLPVSTRVSIAHRPEIDAFVPVVLADQSIGYVHGVCLNITHSADAERPRPDLLDPNTRRALNVGELKRQVLRAVGQQAAATAKRFIGTPYLWGGCTPFGIDCSGFVQLAYKLSGVQLLRDANLQYADRRFRRVDEGLGLDDVNWEPGDLIVFSSREDSRPTHIGLALGDGRFIHALGQRGVCIHPCDTPRFQNTFVGAVRISEDADLAVEAG
jgi:hypothetical protein